MSRDIHIVVYRSLVFGFLLLTLFLEFFLASNSLFRLLNPGNLLDGDYELLLFLDVFYNLNDTLQKGNYLVVDNLRNIFLFRLLLDGLESGDSLVLQFTEKRNFYQNSFLRFGLQAKRKGKVESGTHGDEYSNEVNAIRNCPNFRTCNFPRFNCCQKNAFSLFQKIFFCYVQEKRGCYVSAIPWYNGIACLVVECTMVARSMRLYS